MGVTRKAISKKIRTNGVLTVDSLVDISEMLQILQSQVEQLLSQTDWIVGELKGSYTCLAFQDRLSERTALRCESQ